MLAKFVTEHPDFNWDWYQLSKNPNITMKDVLKYPELYREIFSANCTLTIEDIQSNPDFPWDWALLSRNPNINMKFVLDNLDKPWNWPELSYNSGITMKDIQSRSRYLGKWISMNPNLTLQFILENPGLYWNWGYISRFLPLTLEDILCHPEIPWSWTNISRNSCITIKDIKNNPDLSWDYSAFSENPSITMQIILDNPEFPWEITYYMIGNLYIEPENIQKIIDINRDIHPETKFSRLDQIAKIPKQRLFRYLSANPSVTMDFVVNNPDLPWDWEYISGNPNITFSYILNNPRINWNWYAISGNHMAYDDFFRSKHYKRQLSNKVVKLIRENDDYIAKIYNPNRMRSWMSIQDLEEMRLDFGWSMEEFNKYIT